MSRLSFGSRAGGMSDYHGGNAQQTFYSRGPFDSIEALQDALKAEFQAAAESSLPECTTVELSLSLNANLTLNRPTIGPYAEGGDQDLPPEFKKTITNEDGTVKPDPYPKATTAAIVNVGDSKQRQIVQRAASRGIIQAVEATDGYRYSFNNAWAAKDEEGSRFSYICQDSMQNKDRHANGFSRTLKHLKGEGERGPRKPTYDCKGSVSVKFSSTRQRIDVYYRHYAIHQTVADRKPPQRPPPRPKPERQPHETGGLREMLAQVNYAEQAQGMLGNSSPANDSPLAARSESSNIGRPLKRKRETFAPPPPPPPRDPSQPLSLMDLLRQSESANAPPPQSETPKPATKQAAAAPVNYELPSWQTPPPSLTQPSRNGQYPVPYPPPYNPMRSQGTPQQITPTPMNADQSFRQYQTLQPNANAGPSQPLFTTMKPTTKQYLIQTPRTYGTPKAPGYRDHPRARRSCTPCRLAKKKCDEGHPCTSCIKSGRTDCLYEAGTAPPAQSRSVSMPQQPQSQPPQSAQRQQSTQSTQSEQKSSWGNVSQNTAPQPLSQWQQEGQSTTPSTYTSQNNTDISWPNSTAMASTTAARRESPDPWFPKR